MVRSANCEPPGARARETRVDDLNSEPDSSRKPMGSPNEIEKSANPPAQKHLDQFVHKLARKS